MNLAPVTNRRINKGKSPKCVMIAPTILALGPPFEY